MKKLILSLFILFGFFISFSSSEFNAFTSDTVSITIPGGGNTQFYASGLTCVRPANSSSSYTIWNLDYTVQYTYWIDNVDLYCFDDGITFHNSAGWSASFNLYVYYVDSLFGGSSCPVIDQEYCIGNNLCPEYDPCDCEEFTGENWSALYINDIQHESAGVINIDIPDEIDWNYTNEDSEFNLDVVGYNVDTDYIEDIINVQTSKPNKTDLNNIIIGIVPLFVPGIVIILFIYFVFRFIKKLF